MYNALMKDPGLPVTNPTTSYWQQPANKTLLGIRSVTLPSQRDVVIIGSGITACSVTRELLSCGFSGTVTVLEAREICSGATGRNGGRINCVAVQDFDKYRRQFGDQMARDIVRFEMKHYEELLAAAQSLSLEDFESTEIRKVKTCAVVFSEEKLVAMKQQLLNFEAAFPEWKGRWRIAESEEMREKFFIKDARAALIGDAGAAWPYRLVTRLVTKLLQTYDRQLTIESNTPVISVTRESLHPSPYMVETSRGSIRAKHVVYCTEGHTSHLLPRLRGILVPRRGQMTVQNPGQKFKNDQAKCSWSFYYDRGFDYMCQSARTGEIYLGGGDVRGFDDGLNIYGIASDANESLLAKIHLTGLLPIAFGNEHWGIPSSEKSQLHTSWTGILCNSIDNVPLVGKLPREALKTNTSGDRNEAAEWISAGYGGYGMVNAWQCGKAVAQQILGHGEPSWLPDAYKITSKRMIRLQQRLKEIQGSERHLRALL